MNAVVLSGGGSAGAYQIGVWKALKKIKYKYDIVCGSSVGAINACLMCEKSYRKSLKLWSNLNYDMIFSLSKEDENMNLTYLKNIVQNGGMDPSNLEYNLKKYINVDKIYKSKINYRLVTFNVTKKKKMYLTKKDIPKSKFLDYVMASATCYPAFKMKNIDGEKYIDGGYVDNLPISLAIDMGANNIIAIDLKKIGIKKIVKDKNVDITYITPRSKTSNFLIFDGENAKKDIKRGYNDTMKSFNKLDGNKYTFKHNNLNKFIYKYKDKYELILKKTSNTNIIKNILSLLYVNSDDKIYDMMMTSVDFLGEECNIDNTKIYKISDFNKLILNKLNNSTISKIYEKIKIAIQDNNNEEISNIVSLFYREFISAIYLYIILN